MAHFAAKHADQFGRIEFIVVDRDRIVRLNLRDEAPRKRALRLLEGGSGETLKVLLDEVAAGARR